MYRVIVDGTKRCYTQLREFQHKYELPDTRITPYICVLQLLTQLVPRRLLTVLGNRSPIIMNMAMLMPNSKPILLSIIRSFPIRPNVWYATGNKIQTNVIKQEIHKRYTSCIEALQQSFLFFSNTKNIDIECLCTCRLPNKDLVFLRHTKGTLKTLLINVNILYKRNVNSQYNGLCGFQTHVPNISSVWLFVS